MAPSDMTVSQVLHILHYAKEVHRLHTLILAHQVRLSSHLLALHISYFYLTEWCKHLPPSTFELAVWEAFPATK